MCQDDRDGTEVKNNRLNSMTQKGSWAITGYEMPTAGAGAEVYAVQGQNTKNSFGGW